MCALNKPLGFGLAALLALAGLSVSTPTPAVAADKTLLREFMRVTGTGELSLRARDDVIAQLQALYPDVPDSFWRKRAGKIQIKDLDRRLEALYARHFTDQELREIVTFYGTPSGRKLAQTMPMLAQDSLELAREWGQRQADETIDALRDAGYAE